MKALKSMLRRIYLGLVIPLQRLIWMVRGWFSEPSGPFVREAGVSVYDYRIRDWQERERVEEWPLHTATMNIPEAKRLHRKLLRQFVYVKDEVQFNEKDYWATSARTAVTMKGDCEDFAILLVRWFLYSEALEEDVFVFIIPGHAMCGVQVDDNDFMVFDNGAYSKVPILASKLFPVSRKGEKLMPVCGFNVYDKWVYKT